MATSQVDENGVTILKSFLFGERKVRLNAQTADKIPAYDGELQYYKKADSDSIDDLQGTAPIQIKSSSKDYSLKPSIKFPIEKEHLRIYRDNLGVILIRPVYKTLQEYTIYCKILFPLGIQKLLDKSPNHTKTVQVPLTICPTYDDFEKLAYNYFYQRPLQVTYLQTKKDPELDLSKEIKLTIHSMDQGNPIDSILSQYAYTYYTTDQGLKIPTSIEFQEIGVKKNISIKIGEKEYFTEIDVTKRRDGKVRFILNKEVYLELAEGELKFKVEENEQVTISNRLNTMDFISHLIEEESFQLDSRTFELEEIGNPQIDKVAIKEFKKYADFLTSINVDIHSFKLSEYDEEFTKIRFLYELLVDGKIVSLQEDGFHDKIKIADIGKKKILLFFNCQASGEYLVFDYREQLPNDFTVKVNDNVFLCSKYIALLLIWGDSLYPRIEVFENLKHQILDDVQKYYSPQLFDIHIEFILQCIKGYDRTGTEELLDLAEAILDLSISKSKDQGQIDIARFNKIQISYRRSNLGNDEISEIESMIAKYKDDHKMLCGLYLLLDSHRQFDIHWEQMEEDSQKEFRNWPIWYLYDNVVPKCK